jgi:hypothetical protein
LPQLIAEGLETHAHPHPHAPAGTSDEPIQWTWRDEVRVAGGLKLLVGIWLILLPSIVGFRHDDVGVWLVVSAFLLAQSPPHVTATVALTGVAVMLFGLMSAAATEQRTVG